MATNLAVPGRWLRHVDDGTIYPYTESMAGNPAVEEVSEEQAFPEKYIPKKQKGRKPKLDLSTDETEVEKAESKKATKPELNADATKGKAKAKAKAKGSKK